MRITCSLYIDAGYLLAASASRVTGTSLRNGIYVEYPSLISALVAEAEARADMPLLRVHWYDSARNGVPDAQQERIGELSKVKLRLGRFGVDGQQKGVDLRIGLDLVAHARNAASDVFFLVTGDDDLAEAVEEAQVHGVQVVILGVPGADGKPHGVSRHLVRAADELEVLPGELIDNAVMRVETPASTTPSVDPAVASPSTLAKIANGKPTGATATPPRPPLPSPGAPVTPAVALAYSGVTGRASQVMPGYDLADIEAHDDAIDLVIRQVLASYSHSATEGDLAAMRRGRPSIPSEIDRALLLDVSEALDMPDLPDAVRHRIRSRFWTHVDA